MPVLRERNRNVARNVSAACDILGDEDAFMSQLAAQALRVCTKRRQEGLIVLDGARLASAEVAIARRMVRLAVRQLDQDARLELRHVESVLACVASGEGSTTLPAGIDVRMEFGACSMRTAAAREELTAGWLTVPGRMALAAGRVLETSIERVPAGSDILAYVRRKASAAPAGEEIAFVDAASLGYAERDLVRLKESGDGVPVEARAARLWVDSLAPGDLMCPLGMHGRSKKVSDILGEEQVPVAERPLVPIVRTAPGGAVVWVGGIRLDERFKCTAMSRVLIQLTIHSLDSAE